MNKYRLFSCVDIETAPIGADEALQFAPEFSAPSNYKDPEKIKVAIEESRQEWLSNNALRATTGTVVAIGWMDEQGGQRIYCHGPEEERSMIGTLWSHLFTAEDTRVFITFFGNRFDWRFLIQRSWKLGLDVPGWVIDDRGYLSHRFIDLAKIWSCGDPKETISLDRLSRYLQTGKKEMNGEKFHELLTVNREAAEAYLSHDLNLTWNNALKMGVTKRPVL